MNLNKRKIIVILISFTIITQICFLIFPNISFAENSLGAGEWDISANKDGSIKAVLDNDGTLNIMGNGSMENWTKESLAPWYEKRASITKVNISEGVTSIGSYAFYNLETLREVKIAKEIISIKESAFEGCTVLKDLQIPEGVTSIGDKAFSRCISLEEMIIPEGVISLGNYVFNECTELATVDMPKTLTSIGEGNFNGCTSLTNVNLSKGITKIGYITFKGCTKLEKIIISEGVKEIGYLAFENCTALENVVIPKEVTSIHSQAFENCDSIHIICKSNTIAETYSRENNIPYTVDYNNPKIEFIEGELENNWKKTSITVDVTDSLSGVNEDSLKYVWSQKSTDVEIEEITNSFKNGEKIQNDTLTGEYYLWILAYDNIGNYIIQSSDVQRLDNTLPTITVMDSEEDLIITVAEIGAGLSTLNNYEYYISTSESVLTEGTWELYKSGRAISIKKGRTENYYLFVKQISDKAGNVSSTKGTIVTIGEETYHRFGPYIREKEDVIFTPNGNQKWENGVLVKIIGLENSSSENYKYAWVEDSKELNIGDLATDLNCKEFKVNGSITNNGTENGKYNLVIIEEVTNKIIAKTKVFNLTTDVIAPNLEISYSTKEETNENIIVTITADEELQQLEGWDLSEDKKQLTKEYELNTEEMVVIKDIVGNETKQDISISNIDKKVPGLKIVYSTDKKTTEDVIVIIIADEPIQKVEGWRLSEDNTYLSKIFKSNQKETIRVKDILGNISNIDISVENIQSELQFKDYTISEEKYILGISAGTTIQELAQKMNITSGYEIKEKGEPVTDGIVKTGQTIEVENNSSYTIIIKGDTDGDGKIKLSDLSKTNRERLGKIELEKEFSFAADVNDDGKVDFKDIVKLNRLRLTKVTEP